MSVKQGQNKLMPMASVMYNRRIKNKGNNMKLEKVSLIVAIIIFLLVSFLPAEEILFQTTSEEMIKELDRNPIKTRSLGSGTRDIKVVQRINNKIEETIVMIDESVDVPRLRVKIEFDYNSSALKKTSYLILKEVGKALHSDQLKNKIIIINGHTDSDGPDQYNLNLSFRRADTVKSYLNAAYDIPGNRLLIRGYGEFLPLKPNTTFYNKQLNRRVEFEISY